MTTTTRIAVVTGGNRGIGLEICRGLARLDYTVVLTSRDLSKGEKAAREIGKNVIPYALDVTQSESIQALAQFVRNTFGHIDALVNNAAVYLDDGASVLDVDMHTVRDTLETNLYGPLQLCQAFVPMMRERNYGRVVNVSSESGSLTHMGGYTAAYAMSKTALNALTRILAAEVSRKNIKVNSMCPGWVHTEMGGASAPRTPEQGADTAIWLATLPDNGPTNGFFRDRKPIAW